MKLLMKSSCLWSCYSSEQFSLFLSPPLPSPLSPSLLLLLFKRLPLKEHKTVSFCSEFTGQKRINSSVIVSLTQSLISLPRQRCLIKFPFLCSKGKRESLMAEFWIFSKPFGVLWGPQQVRRVWVPKFHGTGCFPSLQLHVGRAPWLGSGSFSSCREMIPGDFSLFIFLKERQEHPGRAQTAPGPAWLNTSRKRTKKSRKK